MSGSATTTIVMSTSSMNVPRQTASNVQFLCGVLTASAVLTVAYHITSTCSHKSLI